MMFNEFQRELRAKGIDGPVGHMFTLVYEQVRAQAKELDDLAGLVLRLVEQMQGMTELMSLSKDELDDIKKRVGMRNAEVRSEPWSPGS